MRRRFQEFLRDITVTEDHLDIFVTGLPWVLFACALMLGLCRCAPANETDTTPEEPANSVEPPFEDENVVCWLEKTADVGRGYEPTVSGNGSGFLVTWTPTINGGKAAMRAYDRLGTLRGGELEIPNSDLGIKLVFPGLDNTFLVQSAMTFFDDTIMTVLHRVDENGVVLSSIVNANVDAGIVTDETERTMRVDSTTNTLGSNGRTSYRLARICDNTVCDEFSVRETDDRYTWGRGLATIDDTVAFGIMRTRSDQMIRDLVLMIHEDRGTHETVFQSDYGFPQMRIEKVFAVRGHYIVHWSDNRGDIYRNRLTRIKPDGEIGRTVDIPWAYGSAATNRGFMLVTSDETGVAFRYFDLWARERSIIPITEETDERTFRPELAASGSTFTVVHASRAASSETPTIKITFLSCN